MGSEPTSTPLCGWGCLGNLRLCPVPQKSRYGWVVVRGWGWVLLNTVNLISFLKKKKRQRKKQHMSADDFGP